MKIICGVHGGQSGIEISPDLLPLLEGMESGKVTFKRVRFLFEDEAHWDTVLTQEFCRQHAIPYQDEFPPRRKNRTGPRSWPQPAGYVWKNV